MEQLICPLVCPSVTGIKLTASYIQRCFWI